MLARVAYQRCEHERAGGVSKDLQKNHGMKIKQEKSRDLSVAA